MERSKLKAEPPLLLHYILVFISSLTFLATIKILTVQAYDPSTSTVSATTSDESRSAHNGLKNPNHLRYDMVSDVQIECNSDNIIVTMNTMNNFNGMIYPKGLSKNSTCMVEYHSTSNVTYLLPLRSCNTMSTDVDDGIEFFNTVMVQPHRRLVTNQGRGYHIRCRYQTKDKTISNGQQFNVNMTNTTPVVASASMPSCTMKIYSANDLSNEVVAENVKIGDKLQLIVQLEYQEVYGMTVTNCLVRDGLNWGEQPLVNDYGCPVDEEIMPEFVYSHNLTRATVTFQAHKFPYTSSVYYQCNVRLCIREGGCDNVPPDCSRMNQVRRKRFVEGGEVDGVASGDLLKPKSAEVRDLSMEVYSGLHVNENDSGNAAANQQAGNNNNRDDVDSKEQSAALPPNRQAQQAEQEFCISMRRFAIAVSLISLLLMLAVIMLVACILKRRKRKKEAAATTNGSGGNSTLGGTSIYSRPYSNRGYSRG